MLTFAEAKIQPVEIHARRSGERKSWVLVMPLGQHHAQNKASGEMIRFDVNEDLALELAAESRRMLYNFEQYTAPGMTPIRVPIKTEHEPDGQVNGVVEDFKVSGEGRWRGVYALMGWNESTWSDIHSERVRYVSPGIKGKYVDDHGVEYGPVINEVSITGEPRLKSIGTIQDTLTLRLSEADMDEIEKLKKELAEIKAAKAEEIQKLQTEREKIEEKLLALTEKVSALETPSDEDPAQTDGTPEETDEDPVEIAASESDKLVLALSETVKELAGTVKELQTEQKKTLAKIGLSFSESGGSGIPPEGVKSQAERLKEALQAAKAEGKTGMDAVRAARQAVGS